MKRSYRISSRFRFIAFVAISIILLTAFANFVLGLDIAHSATAERYMEISVASGDTLWKIAETYMPADMDTREAVYKLCSINDITASDLMSGMTLRIPV